ncbi:MAG: DsbA family protein [Mariprofundaceae bacterium]
MKLYYILDPMCSWCWAFHPVWQQVKNQLPDDIKVHYLLGGLAPDSHVPMDKTTQQMIRNHWHTIQKKVSGTMFNFDFWTSNTPKRSTYPACRAVIAAKMQNSAYEDAMILAIQQAYYLQAQNPSDDDVLIHCAESIGLDIKQFQQDLNAAPTQHQLLNDIKQAQAMQIFSFPSLVVENNATFQLIHIDYNNADKILAQLRPISQSDTQ